MRRKGESAEFWSTDRRFGVRLSVGVVAEIRQLCVRNCGVEIGGILAGRYTEDRRCAEVTAASGLPDDSVARRTWLLRGIRALTNWLRRCWKRNREYYLGEWHYHPATNIRPSQTDKDTMLAVARSDKFDCPEPILLIVGQGHERSIALTALVFTRAGEEVQLWAGEDDHTAI